MCFLVRSVFLTANTALNRLKMLCAFMEKSIKWKKVQAQNIKNSSKSWEGKSRNKRRKVSDKQTRTLCLNAAFVQTRAAWDLQALLSIRGATVARRGRGIGLPRDVPVVLLPCRRPVFLRSHRKTQHNDDKYFRRGFQIFSQWFLARFTVGRFFETWLIARSDWMFYVKYIRHVCWIYKVGMQHSKIKTTPQIYA